MGGGRAAGEPSDDPLCSRLSSRLQMRRDRISRRSGEANRLHLNLRPPFVAFALCPPPPFDRVPPARLLGALLLLLYMLRSISHYRVPLPTLRPATAPLRSLSSLALRPSPSPLRSFKPPHSSQRSLKLSHLHQHTRNMVTIDESVAYKPNAPSPFVTAPGEPLDHLLDGYKLVPAQDGLPAYAQFTNDIEQSPNDDRQYR